MGLSAKSKLGFIDGTVTASMATTPALQQACLDATTWFLLGSWIVFHLKFQQMWSVGAQLLKSRKSLKIGFLKLMDYKYFFN